MSRKIIIKIKRSLSWGIKSLFTLLFAFFVVLSLIVQPLNEQFKDYKQVTSQGDRQEAFLHELTPYAQEVSSSHGVRPSLLVAQAALESNWGESKLATESNNYFGIKNADGKVYQTQEFTQSEWTEIQATFKQYDSVHDSVLDYANLLKNGTSWNKDLYKGVIEASTYKEAAHALTEAGYATDPKYAEKLIQIIEDYELNTLDHLW